jgi:hypothetical protein
MNNNKFDILSRYIPLKRFEEVCAQGLFLANATLFKDQEEGRIAVRALIRNIDESQFKNVEVMKSYFYINSWYSGEGDSKTMRDRFGEICIKTSYDQLKNISRQYGQANCTHNVIIGTITRPFLDKPMQHIEIC